jgi:hypothetical protein
MSLYSTARSSSSDPSLTTLVEKELPVVPRHRRILFQITFVCKRLVRYWWAWEFLAAAMSITATIALIIVLREADGRAQRSFHIGAAQLTLNTIVAAISTIIRSSLMVTVAGALSQSSWNWFSSPRQGSLAQSAKPLKDLDVFGDASFDSWSSLKLLWRTKFR